MTVNVHQGTKFSRPIPELERAGGRLAKRDWAMTFDWKMKRIVCGQDVTMRTVLRRVCLL